jgi:hypothetical protein
MHLLLVDSACPGAIRPAVWARDFDIYIKLNDTEI